MYKYIIFAYSYIIYNLYKYTHTNAHTSKLCTEFKLYDNRCVELKCRIELSSVSSDVKSRKTSIQGTLPSRLISLIRNVTLKCGLNLNTVRKTVTRKQFNTAKYHLHDLLITENIRSMFVVLLYKLLVFVWRVYGTTCRANTGLFCVLIT